MPDVTKKIVDFLTTIGIPVSRGQVPADSFLPGLTIINGAIVYDSLTLSWPGDLLHEAGHIATVPASMRDMLNDSFELSPTVVHGGEAEATAWAYAAIMALDMAPSILFHHEGYRGKSSELIATYSLGVYPGCYGLAQAGMTLLGADAISANIPPYPNMIQWLRS